MEKLFKAFVNEHNPIMQIIQNDVLDYSGKPNKIVISEGDTQCLISLYNNHLVKIQWRDSENTIIIEFVDTLSNYHTEQDTNLLIDLLQYGIKCKSQYRDNLVIKPQKVVIGSTTTIVCTLFWEVNNH